MAFCIDPTDPANMTPEERLTEIAAIRAEGVLRLRRRQAGSAPTHPHIHGVESADFHRLNRRTGR